jgi:hypothetical protein
MHTRSLIHLQLNAVRVKPPINRVAEAFKSTFGRLYGPFDASGATDHDTLLQAPELMTIGAEQIFEKADSIAHRFRLSNLRMPPARHPSFDRDQGRGQNRIAN